MAHVARAVCAAPLQRTVTLAPHPWTVKSAGHRSFHAFRRGAWPVPLWRTCARRVGAAPDCRRHAARRGVVPAAPWGATSSSVSARACPRSHSAHPARGVLLALFGPPIGKRTTIRVRVLNRARAAPRRGGGASLTQRPRCSGGDREKRRDRGKLPLPTNSR